MSSDGDGARPSEGPSTGAESIARISMPKGGRIAASSPARPPPGLEELGPPGESRPAQQQRGTRGGQQSRQQGPPGESRPAQQHGARENRQQPRPQGVQQLQRPQARQPRSQNQMLLPTQHHRQPAQEPLPWSNSGPGPAAARPPLPVGHQYDANGRSMAAHAQALAQAKGGQAMAQQGWDGRRQPNMPQGMPGYLGDVGMGMRDPSWMGAAHHGYPQPAQHQPSMEMPMLPSPGLPTGPAMQMEGMMPMQWGMVPQSGERPPSHAVQGHFRNAIAGALQKFAAAEEVQRVAAERPVVRDSPRRPKSPSKYGTTAGGEPGSPALSEEAQFQQRMKAKAQAEATAMRLMASSAAAEARVEVEAAEAIKEDAEAEAEAEMSNEHQAIWPGAEEKRYEGRVKVFDVNQGFGFIQSFEVHQLYGCDAFLNQAVAGTFAVGSQVTFTVEMKKGKPQARNVIVDGSAEVEEKKEVVEGPYAELLGRTHFGRVKSFNSAKGFGFIMARDLQHAFGGRDIYVPRTQAPSGSLSVGQEVEFRLTLDKQGQPQARDIKLFHRQIVGADAGLSTSAAGMPLFS